MIAYEVAITPLLEFLILKANGLNPQEEHHIMGWFRSAFPFGAFLGTLLYHLLRRLMSTSKTLTLVEALLFFILIPLRVVTYDPFFQVVVRLAFGCLIGATFLGSTTLLISYLPASKKDHTLEQLLYFIGMAGLVAALRIADI